MCVWRVFWALSVSLSVVACAPADKPESTIVFSDAEPGSDRNAEILDASLDDASADGSSQLDAAPDASLPQSLRIGVISDLNSSYGSTTYLPSVHGAVAQLLIRDVDLAISTGDMVAGQSSGLNYGAMWKAFHAVVTEPLADSGIPLFVTPGNHDASRYREFSQERELFVTQWTERRPEAEFVDDEHYPLRYAFKQQDTLFVSLDATVAGPFDIEQMSWLNRVLEDNPASVKVVYGHLPLYPITTAKKSEVIGDASLEQLLNKHEVDLFLSGHHHAYYPGKRQSLRLTAMPCLGDAPGFLPGKDQREPRSLVIVEVLGDAVTSIEAYAAPDFAKPVARQTLPESLNSGEQKITRDDL